MNIIKQVFIGIGLAGLLAAAEPAFAQEPPAGTQGPARLEQRVEPPAATVHGSLRTDYLTQYIFRGFPYSEGPVVQQTASAGVSTGYLGVTLIGFGNLDLDTQMFTEADGTLDVAIPMSEYFTLSGGSTLLTFPNLELPDSAEVYGGVTCAVPGLPLQVGAKGVHDFNNGTYGELSLGSSVDLGSIGLPEVSVSAQAALGLNFGYFREESGPSHGELRLSASIPLLERVSLVPSFGYSIPLDKEFDNHFVAGVGLEIKF